MLIFSMSVSADGFIADREGGFGWSIPSDELFRFHLEEVRELGGFLSGRRLYGGAGLAAQAIELGLVDELRMFRHPIVVGGGTPFLPPVTEAVPLDLIETRTFGSRVVYERYRRLTRSARLS
jgi:dihydrofolate reductase